MFKRGEETANVNEARWRYCSYTMESSDSQREAYSDSTGIILDQFKEENNEF